MRWPVTRSPSRTVTASWFHSAVSTPLEKFPAPADDEAAVDPSGLALRIRDPRGDQDVGVLAPDLVLRALVVERDQELVDRVVAHVPGGRCAAASKLSRNVDERDEIQLHAAPAPRLHDAKQPRTMQIGLDLGQHAAFVLATLGALAQRGHQLARAGNGFFAADARETAVAAAQRGIPPARGISA